MLDVVCSAFHNDDRVVDHDSDRQHDSEQRRQIDGETQCGHRCERTDDRDRHCRCWNQHRAPVLQENKDHDEDKQARLNQCLVDFVYRGRDEFRGVERDVEFHVLRKSAGHCVHFLPDGPFDLEGVCARRLKDADAGSGLVVQ